LPIAPVVSKNWHKDIGCPAENIDMLGQFHNDVIHPTAGCLAIAKTL
jgi:hypothetical protein